MNMDADKSSLGLYLTVNGGLRAIEFYKSAFGAVVTTQHLVEDGRLMHAALELFGGEVMLSDHFPDHSEDVAPPDMLGGSTVTIQVNFAMSERVDQAMARAMGCGARVTMAPWNSFWGMRYGRIVDPFGHTWAFSAPCPLDESTMPMAEPGRADGPPALPKTVN